MRTFYAVGGDGSTLGSVIQVVGDSIRYKIDYDGWLAAGEILDSVSVTPSSVTAAVTNVLLVPDEKAVYFFVQDAIAENFTLSAVATTSIGQVRTDTVDMQAIVVS